jgi:hypothetical protein
VTRLALIGNSRFHQVKNRKYPALASCVAKVRHKLRNLG